MLSLFFSFLWSTLAAQAGQGTARLELTDEGNFGKAGMGKSVERKFVLENKGSLKIGKISTSIEGGFAFSIKETNCEKELKAGESCAITVEGRVVLPDENSAELIVTHTLGRLRQRLFIAGLAYQRPPIAEAITVQTDEDIAVTGELNATDPDGDKVSYHLVQDGRLGHLEIKGGQSGTFSYVPDKNQAGTDKMTYKANDGERESAPTSLTVIVRPVNDAPIVDELSFHVESDKTYSGQFVATDIEDDKITFSVTQPALGKVNLTDAKNGLFLYTPNKGAKGKDSFVFTATDAKGASTSVTAHITVGEEESPQRGLSSQNSQVPLLPSEDPVIAD